jgi:hypothetical protein
MVMKKHVVLALLHEMPDDIDTEDLMYRLYLWQKIEVAEAAAEAGVEKRSEWDFLTLSVRVAGPGNSGRRAPHPMARRRKIRG